MQTEASQRSELLRIARLGYQHHYFVAEHGELSIRLSDDEVLCLNQASHLGTLTDRDVLVINMNGDVLRGQGLPSSWIEAHLLCYANRPDIRAVISAHPPIAMAFTVAGVTLDATIWPAGHERLGGVPILPFSAKDAQIALGQVGQAIQTQDALLLARSGAIVVGNSLQAAFSQLERLEHIARIMWHAHTFGTADGLALSVGQQSNATDIS